VTIDGSNVAPTEEYIDEMGTILENSGFCDKDIDAFFLEHYGMRGMKWGVRRQRRQQALVRAGTKGGYKSSRVRGALGRLGPVDLIRGRGVRKGLARKAVRVGGQLERHKAGKATGMDLLKRYGSTRITDLVPVRTSRAGKQTTHKADIAVVTAAGAVIAGKIIASQLSKRAVRGL
jgi:hypothetical protein